MRIVHYLNQFFAGVGGEEKAGIPLETREGAVGPGKLFEQLIGSDAKVVLTLACGDNDAVENQDTTVAAADHNSPGQRESVDCRAALPSRPLRHGRRAVRAAAQSQLNILCAAMSEANLEPIFIGS